MTQITENDIRATLSRLTIPETGQRLDLMDAISRIIIGDGMAGIILDFGDKRPEDPEKIRLLVENTVAGMQGIQDVNVVLTASKPAEPEPSIRPSGKPVGAHATPAPPTPEALPGVKHIIAVASGKGGVGKSTTSVNLALGLAQMGLKTGIMDADIFGPSLPTLLGNTDRPTIKNSVIAPHKLQGVKAMSIGFLVDIDQPVVWRGPRVMGAVQQLLKDVAWAPLDVLVVDMPPGTGDVQLSMVQTVPLSGAVMVSTPQDLSLIDARKGIAMFEKTNVPILGLIENMSYYTCKNCGHEEHIFGHGGAQKTASDLGIPFLGAIPLEPVIRSLSDAGTPVVTDKGAQETAGIYLDIAQKIKDSLKL